MITANFTSSQLSALQNGISHLILSVSQQIATLPDDAGETDLLGLTHSLNRYQRLSELLYAYRYIDEYDYADDYPPFVSGRYCASVGVYPLSRCRSVRKDAYAFFFTVHACDVIYSTLRFYDVSVSAPQQYRLDKLVALFSLGMSSEGRNIPLVLTNDDLSFLYSCFSECIFHYSDMFKSSSYSSAYPYLSDVFFLLEDIDSDYFSFLGED